METKNAIIKSTTISIDPVFTVWLQLDYGGEGQGFGGYCLCTKEEDFGGRFMRNILETVGVYNWKDLEGKTIRVKADYSSVKSIGHIIEDKWFTPAEFFEEIKHG